MYLPLTLVSTDIDERGCPPVGKRLGQTWFEKTGTTHSTCSYKKWKTEVFLWHPPLLYCFPSLPANPSFSSSSFYFPPSCPRQMTKACTDGFAVATDDVVAAANSAISAITDADAAGARNTARKFLKGLSVFFAYGAQIEPRDLIELASVLSLKQLKDCFLGGLACVDNPFIPGVR